MAKKKLPLSEKEIEHITKLRKHPEMMERVAAILEICDGPEGEIKSADEVEALLIEEMRKLGRTSMGQWAKESEGRSGAEHQKNNPGSYCGKKRPELVERLWQSPNPRTGVAKFHAKLPESILRSHWSHTQGKKPCAQAGFERLRSRACLCPSGSKGQRALRH